MKRLNNYERGFIEAIIDAEASLSLYVRRDDEVKRRWRLHVTLSISNNSLELLDKIQNILGTKLNPVLKKPTNPNHNKNYSITFRHNVLKWLLPQLVLINKEKRRLKSIEIINTLGRYNQFNKPAGYENKLKTLRDDWHKLRVRKSYHGRSLWG